MPAQRRAGRRRVGFPRRRRRRRRRRPPCRAPAPPPPPARTLPPARHPSAGPPPTPRWGQGAEGAGLGAPAQGGRADPDHQPAAAADRRPAAGPASAAAATAGGPLRPPPRSAASPSRRRRSRQAPAAGRHRARPPQTRARPRSQAPAGLPARGTAPGAPAPTPRRAAAQPREDGARRRRRRRSGLRRWRLGAPGGRGPGRSRRGSRRSRRRRNRGWRAAAGWAEGVGGAQCERAGGRRGGSQHDRRRPAGHAARGGRCGQARGRWGTAGVSVAGGARLAAGAAVAVEEQRAPLGGLPHRRVVLRRRDRPDRVRRLARRPRPAPPVTRLLACGSAPPACANGFARPPSLPEWVLTAAPVRSVSHSTNAPAPAPSHRRR
jgi:hypothetical protein